MTKNLERCLQLAETIPLNEAVKESNITEAEADELVEMMIEQLGRKKWGDEPPRRSQRGIKDIIARLDDLEANLVRAWNALIERFDSQQQAFNGLLEGLDQYIDLTHPGRPMNHRRDAGATAAGLALVTQKVRQLRPRGQGKGMDGDRPKAV